LSEIRLSARKRNTLSLLLADTRLRGVDDEDLERSFITRVHNIADKLPSNRWVDFTGRLGCPSSHQALLGRAGSWDLKRKHTDAA
jgi:hypothetical protein